MKKRALSWLLALTMLLTLAPQTLPVWASATGEKSSTATQTESKLSANTYSALGLSRNVDTSALPKGQQPYGKAEPGNTVATNVINELYVNFNGSIHYGWSVLDNLTMQYKDGEGINWTSSDNFYGAMGYWRPNQQTVKYSTGSSTKGALFATNKTAGEHDDHLGKSINSANKHLTYQYSKSEAFSPNTGKDNYVAEMTIDSGSQVYLYIYQVEGGNKRYVRSKFVCDASESGGNASDRTNIIYNWEYDAMYDISAGDMDGDGYDEIAVYAQNCVYVYSFEDGTLSELIKKETVKPEVVNEGGGKYKKLKTAVVTLAFGDLNADDKDELVIAENIGYGATNIDTGKVGIYRLETNESTKKNTLVKAMKDDILLAVPGSSGIFNAGPMVRYANVATGDIDGDYQDELVIAGYISSKMPNATCNRGDIAYMIVKGNSDNQFKHSDWNAVDTTNNRIDLLDRVVDNKDQLIPPVALTCAATQGVGYAEQVFLGGCLYTVNSDNSLKYLTRISTNREYKKDNGNKANKEEIFVVNVVAGNFNGNRNGQEQIVYAFGMKHDDSDRYWYDIGYINKKEPGDTHANESSGYWYGQEQVMNYESSYNRDQNKSRASLYLSLAAVDCDNDSTLMRYKGQTVTWTKPEVLTILQSAPYFQDLEDTRGYLDQGQTGLGKSKAAGDKVTAGGSLSLGTYVSFEQDFSVFGVKVASIEAEAQSKNSFTYAYEETKKKETEINYSGSAGDDYAVVYAVPYMEYQYETWVPEYTLPPSKNEEYYKYIDNYLSGKLKNWSTIKSDPSKLSAERTKAEKELGIRPNMTVEGSWQPSSVMVPMEPAKVLITVDDYDEIAEQTGGLEPIRGNILNSTPGDPATYDAVGARSNDFHAIGNQQKVTTGEGGNITVTETSTTEKSHDFEYSYEFEAKVGAGAGGLTVGVLAGFGANAGGGISTSSSKSYSATVDNLPKDASQYGFSWQFGWRNAKLNNNDVLVLEYQIKDVAQLPSPPKNLRVESVTSDSVTLSWDPVTGAGAYNIYQVSSTGGLFYVKTLAGTATSWTNEELNSNSSYTYVAETITQDGNISLTSKKVEARTLESQGSFQITKQPDDPDPIKTGYAGSTVTLELEAQYLGTNNKPKTLYYQWEVYDTKAKTWKSASGASRAASYTATVTDANDGERYRCLVYSTANLYLYSREVTLQVGLADSKTVLTTPDSTAKSTYFITTEVEAKDEQGNPIYEQVPVVDNGRTKYSYKDGYVYVEETTNATTGEKSYSYYASATDTTAFTQVPQQVLTFGDKSYDVTLPAPTDVTNGEQHKYIIKKGTGDVTADITYIPQTAYSLSVGNETIALYRYQEGSVEQDNLVDFWFVEVTEDGTTKQYVAEVDTVQKLKIDENTLIDISTLEVVTEQSKTKAKTTVQQKQDGDTVNLSVTVSDNTTSGDKQTPTGKVTFKIVNTTGDGGVTETVQVGTDGKATMNWKPTTAGVYVVTAIYSGSDTFKESQSNSYTINVVTPGEQKLVVSGENMTYGDRQELKATLFDGKSDSESTTGVSAKPVTVTYAVTRDGNDVTSSNEITTDSSTDKTMFKPLQAGTYTITATYSTTNDAGDTSDATTNNSITTTKVIVVGRKTVKIVPKVNADKTITYNLPDIPNEDKTTIKNAIDTSCIGLADGAKAGIYPIVVKYNENNSINSKYLIVCDNDQKYEVKGDVVHVTNATTDSNGKVKLQYTDSKGNTYDVGENGQSLDVPKGVKLTATAMPNLGYRVEQWKVNSNTQMNGVTPVTNPTFEIQIPENTTLENWTVEATFTQIYYKLNYSIENGGEITAKYLTDNGGTGTPFNSGDQLSPLQKVQLTAEPASGQAICEWQVDGETIKNKDGTNYTGATYEVSSISKETSIVVKTEQTSECPVTVTVVGSDNQPLGNATVSFNPAREATDGTYPGQKNQSLTITLNIPDSLIVESWSTAAGQEMQGTLSSDKKKLTISNLRSALNLTVKCVTPNMYTVTQAVNAGGRIEVYKGLTDNTPLSFTDSEVDVPQASLLRVLVKPDDGYQVKSVTVGDTPPTLNDIIGSEDKSFVINSVYGPTTIHVEFVKKPVVTFTAGAGSKGTIEVSNGPSVSGGTVPYGYKNDIVFTAKPEPGYEVDKWTVNTTEVNGQKVANSDNQTYTYTPGTDGITDDLTVTVSFKALPKATVEFSVVDTNGTDEGGTNGTLTATAERKGMANYNTAYLNFKSGDIVYAGSTVTFTATPNTGYRVQEWKVNGGVQKDNGLNITANTLTLSDITEATEAKTTVTVQFMQVGSQVTAAAGGNGRITSAKVANDDVDYASGFILAEGAQATFTAQPETGYEVDRWFVNGSEGQSGGTTFNYTAASGNTGAAITVTFRQIEYQVEWTATHGTVTLPGHTGESATIRGGEELSFTASPADGYTLIDWKVNGERQNSHATSFQWTVPNGAAMSPAVSTFVIEPVFSRGTYAVTITKPDHASITANKQNLSAVTGGEEVTFTAAPEDGYILIGWTVNGTTTNTRALTHKVEVNEVTTVTAVIVPSHYAITYQADNSANGTVSVEGHTENPVSVAYGENITFKAEPKNYYHVAGWKVDDTMQPNSANKDTFTLENVTATQTVTAVFGEAVRYTVSYQVEGGNGSLSAKAGGENLTLNPDQTTPVLGGTKLVFTAAPNNDYMVKEWKIDSNTVEGNLSNKLEIGSLEKKTIVTVSFEPLKLHTITANGTECEIKDVIRTPSDYGDDTHVRDRGTVSFKVVPTKASMGLQGLPENAKVVYNSDGSYTVTVTNVTSDISFQMKEYQAKTGNLQIPSEYTESALKSALRKQIHSSVSGSDIAYLDIKLQIKTGSNPDVWEDVTSANFPQGGIDITIPYSALGQSGLDSSYNYSVAHMLENGTVENLSAKGGTSGVTFHVNSLSPFAIGWYKNTPTPGGGGGGGGGGAVSTYTLTFDTNGGSAIDKITKDSGTTIDLAAYKPTRTGYTFAGWFSDKALTKAVTSVKLTANTTVYAKWTQNGGTAQNPFVDVKEGAYYYDAVLWAVEQKITSGTSATTFSPDASCTRAQMVTFLWRAAGSPKVENGKNPFTDVQADAYYYDAVLWAVEKGVTSGTSATTFSPDATVTRGQTVTFLYRNAGSPEVSGTMPFTDVEADAYYAKAVQWAVQQKITTGTSETTFSPMSDCTRGQIVTFLYRAK